MIFLRRHYALLSALFFGQTALVYLYLAQEQTVHFWDYAMYANMALAWFQENLSGAGGASFWKSFAQNYNLLFALPSQPAFYVFAPTREIFILANAVFYVIPAQLALGLVLHKIIGGSKKNGLLLAVAGSLLVPVFWMPLLQGYPDHAAAACLYGAFYLALSRDKEIGSPIGAGLLLALAVVFRRHFAYPALALILSCGLLDLRLLFQGKGAAASFKTYVVRYGSMGLSALALLLSAEPLYLEEMLTTNFTALYASYTRAPLDYALFLFSRLGVVLLFAALAGHWLLWRKNPSSRSGLSLLFLFSFLWLLLWMFGPAQNGEHYLTGLPPLFCLVGLAGIFSSTFSGKLKTLVFLVLAAQSLLSFWPRDTVRFPSDPPVAGLLNAPRPPWVRGDLKELESLARHIARTTTAQEKIVVAGSSFVFNQDLLRATYMDKLKDFETPQRFIPAPEVDKQQGPPLDVFATADVFLVPDKPQYHLDPSGQTVVTALWSVFASPRDGFEKDPLSFRLERETVVSVWRKKKQTGAFLHRNLEKIRAVLPSPRAWIVSRGAPFVQTASDPARGVLFAGPLSDALPETALFFDKPLDAGKYRLGLELRHETSCAPPQIDVRIEDSAGRVLFEKSARFVQNPGIYFVPFVAEKNSYLFLSLSRQRGGACLFVLSSLKLERFAL